MLLTVGRKFDPSELGAVPENAHVERWVDQAEALVEADLVVCHGGSGTVLGALATGVPLVIMPLFADQFENAQRVATVGASRVVEAASKEPRGSRSPLLGEDALRIRQEIEAVFAQSSYRRQSRDISKEMATAPPIDDVLADLLAAG